MKRIFSLVAAGAVALTMSAGLTACLSTSGGGPTPASCADAKSKLALAQAGIPALQAAVTAALAAAHGNTSDQGYLDAEAALAAGQVLVAAYSAYLTSECGPAPSTPVAAANMQRLLTADTKAREMIVYASPRLQPALAKQIATADALIR